MDIILNRNTLTAAKKSTSEWDNTKYKEIQARTGKISDIKVTKKPKKKHPQTKNH